MTYSPSFNQVPQPTFHSSSPEKGYVQKFEASTSGGTDPVPITPAIDTKQLGALGFWVEQASGSQCTISIRASAELDENKDITENYIQISDYAEFTAGSGSELFAGNPVFWILKGLPFPPYVQVWITPGAPATVNISGVIVGHYLHGK